MLNVYKFVTDSRNSKNDKIKNYFITEILHLFCNQKYHISFQIFTFSEYYHIHNNDIIFLGLTIN